MNASKSQKKINPLLTSIVLHVVMLLAMGLSINYSRPVHTLGDADTLVVNSYLFRDNITSQAMTKKSSDPAKQLAKNKSGIIAEKKSLPVKRTGQQTAQHSQASHGVQTQELLALLHAAIQKQQQYPDSAIQMEREGRVTLGFTLFPDGTIRNLKMIKSSQSASLDNAALMAVQNAVPFQQIQQYLKEAQEFNIDVVFELT